MSQGKTPDIIKGAILLERRGKAFYVTTARNTRSNAVREIFETMAAEEQKHIDILTQHYQSLARAGKLSDLKCDVTPQNISTAVLTKKVREQITAASYEAAAITAAMAMEDNAVKFYSEQAHTTSNPLEKE